MATVDEDLKTFLQANSALAAKIGSRVHENHVPMRADGSFVAVPFIWFAQTGEVRADALGDTVGTLPIGYEFSLEVVAQSIRDARTTGALVVACLHLLQKATFGSRTIQAVFCEDQSDQYVSQTGAIDRGFHVSAYNVQVFL